MAGIEAFFETNDIESFNDIIAQLESILFGESDAEICHKPGTNVEQTKYVSVQALQNHLNHGDEIGVCVP